MKGFTACLMFLAAGSNALPQYRPPSEPTPRPNHGGGGSQGGDNIDCSVIRIDCRQVEGPHKCCPGGTGEGLNNLPDGCRIEYQTVHSTEWTEEEKEVCTPYTDTVCTTEYRQKCTPYQDKECKTVPKQKCETKYEEVCQNLWRDVPEKYTEDVCETYNVKSCQQHWKTYPNGDKKWEDDPSTCKELPETKCEQVEKTRNKPEQYRDCKQVPKQNCYIDQVEECYPITKQNCVDVPEEVCEQVTRDKCEIKHTRTPQSKATQKAVRVCNNHIGGEAHDSGSSGEDFELVQSVRSNDEPESSDDGSRIGFTFSE